MSASARMPIMGMSTLPPMLAAFRRAATRPICTTEPRLRVNR